MRIIIAIAVLFWCNAFVFAQEPDWVRGKSKMYPDEFYIVGVGSGDTRQDAESRARAHIAEVFSVNIKSDISINKSETLRNQGGKMTAESKEMTRSKIDMGLKKTLEGTEIAEVWQNPKDAMYYALAVLDREKATMKMSERIRELDAEVTRLSAKEDTTRGKINRLKVMLLKKSLMSDRLALGSDYRIVSASGKTIESPYSYEKENSEIVSFLQNQFVIAIVGEGTGSDVISQTVTDLFTAKGFTVERTGDKPADLLIKVSTSVDPLSQPVGEWYYCRWHLGLNATDASNGDVVLSSSENGKSGQLSQDESERRAVYDMNKKVALLAGRLLDKLTGAEE